MRDTSKLRGRIVEKFGTLSAFGREVNCALSFISLYMNGKKDLRQSTMDKWIEALDIPAEQIPEYFFTYKVDE